MALTARQERFVEEYLIDLNGTQAAIRAGYSPRSANEYAVELLANPSVASAVARAKAERSARVGLSADRVIEELAAVGFARMPDFAAWGDGNGLQLKPSDEVDGRVIAQVTQEEKFLRAGDGGEQILSRTQSIKLHDKLSALEKLGKHIGLFTDRHDLRHSGSVSISIESLRQAMGIE